MISFFKKEKVFSTQDLLKFYKQKEVAVNRNTLNWRVYYLIKKGIIARIGKGQFRVGNLGIFKPELSPIIKKINKQLKKTFPFLKYCLWDTEQIRGLSQHLPSLKLTIVDVERDGMEAVFHSLQDKFKNVFLMPDMEVMEKYVIPAKNPIVIKTLVSESPVYEIEGIMAPAIEKVLVDVFFEEEFSTLRGMEMSYIFKNAYEMYSVNPGRLLRYATRKRKKEEIKKFLISNNLAAK